MTELERKALMGDQEAQRECNEQRIMLPCPFCGSDPIVEDDLVFCGSCGLGYEELDPGLSLSKWNTRPAPPIGRCGECKHAYINFISANQGVALCVLLTNKAQGEQFIMPQDGYCSYFEPKEREENAVRRS